MHKLTPPATDCPKCGAAHSFIVPRYQALMGAADGETGVMAWDCQICGYEMHPKPSGTKCIPSHWLMNESPYPAPAMGQPDRRRAQDHRNPFVGAAACADRQTHRRPCWQEGRRATIRRVVSWGVRAARRHHLHRQVRRLRPRQERRSAGADVGVVGTE